MNFGLNTIESYQERFDIAKFSKPINSRYHYFDIIDSKFLFYLKDLKEFQIYEVTIEENRPDLLAEKIYGYGNSQYWWILMILNELRLPKDLKRGMKIKYPSIFQLEDIYLKLNVLDSKPEMNVIGSEKDSIVKKERLL